MMKPSTRWVKMTGLVAPGFSWFSGVVVELEEGEGLGFRPSRGVRGKGEAKVTGGSSGGATADGWMGDKSGERLEIAAKPAEKRVLRTLCRAFISRHDSKRTSIVSLICYLNDCLTEWRGPHNGPQDVQALQVMLVVVEGSFVDSLLVLCPGILLSKEPQTSQPDKTPMNRHNIHKANDNNNQLSSTAV